MLISTFFKQWELHNVNIWRKKFELYTEVVIGGVYMDTSAEDTIIFTPQSLTPKEIKVFKSLTCKKELQSFLGVVATFHR